MLRLFCRFTIFWCDVSGNDRIKSCRSGFCACSPARTSRLSWLVLRRPVLPLQSSNRASPALWQSLPPPSGSSNAGLHQERTLQNQGDWCLQRGSPCRDINVSSEAFFVGMFTRCVSRRNFDDVKTISRGRWFAHPTTQRASCR